MKINQFLTRLLLCSFVISLLCSMPAAALEPPALQATHAILVDAEHGEVLFDELNAYQRAYPASITKVMTALLVLEAIQSGQLSADEMITANETALAVYGSTANIQAGEQMSVTNLLYCLLLPSANEAANVLAEAVDGSIPSFVEHMNRRAKELGCKDTHFFNPHGLHNDQHYTTAYDITLYMAAAMEYDLFREIVNTPSYTVPATNLSRPRLFYNTNALISNLYYLGYVYDKCIGGKTGTTDEAGRCLVAVAQRGEDYLISVILGSGPLTLEDGSVKQGQFTESAKLLRWGFDNFQRVSITKDSTPVDKVAVTLSREADEVMVKPEGSIVRTLPRDMDLSLIQSEIILFSDVVEAPIAAGQVLGSMTFSYEGEEYGTLDLVAVTSVERSELLYKAALVVRFFQNFGRLILLLAILLLALIVLVQIFVLRKRRRYRSHKSKQRPYRRSRK